MELPILNAQRSLGMVFDSGETDQMHSLSRAWISLRSGGRNRSGYCQSRSREAKNGSPPSRYLQFAFQMLAQMAPRTEGASFDRGYAQTEAPSGFYAGQTAQLAEENNGSQAFSQV
jgi:hypothetical protein